MNINRTLLVFGIFNLLNATAFAAGIDCQQAVTKVDKIICESPDLLQKDQRLNEISKANIASFSTDYRRINQLKAEERAWIVRRNRCDDQSCLSNLYDQRISVLSKLNATSSDSGTAFEEPSWLY
jgi:uncharacterized protein